MSRILFRTQVFTILFSSMLLILGCSQSETNKEQISEETENSNSIHNAQNSLDWAGTYSGTLPCGSCSAIKMTIILNDDGTYEQTNVYEHGGEADAVIAGGTFTWNESGKTITLNNAEKPNQFFVGENYLAKLDMDGNRITGDLAEHYILEKEQTETKHRNE